MKTVMTAMRRLRPLYFSTVFLSIAFLSISPLNAKEVIVAIGDSITQGDTQFELRDHRNTIQGGWVTRLRNRLQEDFPDEYEVLNRGINGDTAQGVLDRLDSDVISKQPYIVIIGIGTNDTNGFTEVATPSSTVDAYRAIMEQIFNELQGNLPETSVFVMGMSTPLKKYLDMSIFSTSFVARTQAFFNIQFKEYNTVLKDLTQKFGYFYVDIPSQWPSDVDESWAFYAEGLHPNDTGYDLMAEILYSDLRLTVLHPIVLVD